MLCVVACPDSSGNRYRQRVVGLSLTLKIDETWPNNNKVEMTNSCTNTIQNKPVKKGTWIG